MIWTTVRRQSTTILEKENNQELDQKERSRMADPLALNFAVAIFQLEV